MNLNSFEENSATDSIVYSKKPCTGSVCYIVSFVNASDE